ncbi:hypothetical protein [Sinorhizobium fredii]|uniref:DUF2188 domain-containing protein n=1 Tax=Rhizobium fredii TaxID=380 RepID=A0A2L0H8M8_RHIFR|nr:hypothetical protein [Sinorhizobium fredii]AUX77828.1 hypothetical protein NXT3_CH03286 [Sinorhizobium fredii]
MDHGYVWESGGYWWRRPPGTQDREGPFDSREEAEAGRAAEQIGAAIKSYIQDGGDGHIKDGQSEV